MRIKELIKKLEEYDTSMDIAFEQDIDGCGTMKDFDPDIGEEIPYADNVLWVQIKERKNKQNK